MADYRPYQNMDYCFAKLFEDLSKTWPTRDIAFVQELVSHSEYGEAMENLLALGAKNGKGFTKGQLAAIAGMCAKMGLDTSSAKPQPSATAVLPPRGVAS